VVTNLEPSYFTWKRLGLGVLAALVFGGIWISQPDVGLEAARNVTLQAGHGLYFEATSEGTIVYTKGPPGPTHLFSRIVKKRGWRTYIYLETHFGSYLRYNPETGKIDASGNPDSFGNLELDPELLFLEWRSGRMTHPMKDQKPALPNEVERTVEKKEEGNSKSAMSVGESPDFGALKKDLVIRTRADLKSAFGYGVIEGDVRVVGTMLSDLDELATLSSIKGSLIIENNPALESVHGLRGLLRVDGEIRVEGNQRLPNLEGLRNLGNVGQSIRVAHNPALKTLRSMGSIRSHGGLELVNNSGFSKCSEDYLLSRDAFTKDRAILLSHRVVREGWGGDAKCSEPASKFHKLARDVLDKALEQMAQAMSTLDEQLRMAMEQQASDLQKMQKDGGAIDNEARPEEPAITPEMSKTEDSKKSQASSPGTAFVMPSFGNDVGATLRSEKVLEGQLTGPCVLKGKVRSTEERRRRCRVKRKKWRVTMKLPAYVYMLQSTRKKLIRHIEFGPNPEGRLSLHNEGLIMETADLAPWIMVLKRKFPSGYGAQEYVNKLREKLLKQQKRRAEILKKQAEYRVPESPKGGTAE
jgi:hypothetical protein